MKKTMDDYKKQSKALEAMALKPMLHLSAKELPELAKWKVGQEYKLEVTVKQRSLSENEDGMTASFEIKTVRSLK